MMQVVRLCSFFEGGVSYESLTTMPLDEFQLLVKCSNKLAAEQKAELQKNVKSR